MAYGTIKVDTVTFTDGGIDKSVTLSGLVQNPTFSGDVTVTGTLSGVTITGTTASFTSGVFTSISGATVVLTSGVFASGTAAAPSVSVGTTDNGIYSPGTDQVAISTNGTGRLSIDANGNVAVDTNTLYVDAVNNRVAVGTTSPGTIFQTRIAADKNIGFDLSNGEPRISCFDDAVANAVPLVVNGSDCRFEISSNEKARIDSSGRLLVGTASARDNFFNLGVYTAKHLIEGTGGTGASRGSLAIVNNSATATDPGYLIFGRTKGSAAGSNTALAADDWVGMISFQGSDGTQFVECAQINAYVDGTPGADDMPGRLVFSVTADGSASPTEALRISSNRAITVSDGGNVVLGTTTGTKIGTATTQKLGFYNATPVVQPAAVADATDAASVITQLNDLLSKLRTLGIIAT